MKRFKKIFSHQYGLVLVGILLGAMLGFYEPQTAAKMKPISDGFIALIKMLIGPILFCTLVDGLASVIGLKKMGRIGAKAFVYFEIVSTLALLIGLVSAAFLKPGTGLNVLQNTTENTFAFELPKDLKSTGNTVDMLLHFIPKTLFDAFTGSFYFQ